MEAITWEISLVGFIGSYKIRREGHDKPFILKASTMIDLITRWFKIIQYNDKHVVTIENLEKSKRGYVDTQILQ